MFGSLWLKYCPLNLDPDPGSQNLADQTYPDPKHWFIPRSGIFGLDLDQYTWTKGHIYPLKKITPPPWIISSQDGFYSLKWGKYHTSDFSGKLINSSSSIKWEKSPPTSSSTTASTQQYEVQGLASTQQYEVQGLASTQQYEVQGLVSTQ